jgi:hypothetical protein
MEEESFLSKFLRGRGLSNPSGMTNPVYYNMPNFVPVQYPPTPIGPGNPFNVGKFFSGGTTT